MKQCFYLPTAAALALLLFFSGTSARSSEKPASKPIATNVCSVLSDPSSFAGKEISLRGYVYLGVDAMNISDPKCPGDAIRLSISSAVRDHRDIRDFYKKLNRFGRQGEASLSGNFSVRDDVFPYVIAVQKAWNVTELSD